MDPGIRSLVQSRLEADGSLDPACGSLVLAALEGAEALEAQLSGRSAAPRAAEARASPASGGAFLRSVAVEGFRGIGPAQTLELRPGPAPDLESLGWSAALRTHRPFLSYNELGSLLDEGPSKLYDALSSILGLEDVVQAVTYPPAKPGGLPKTLGGEMKHDPEFGAAMAPLLLSAGAGLVDCQRLEYGLGLLLLYLGRLGVRGISPDRMGAVLDGQKEPTAGQLASLLGDRVPVEPNLASVLADGLEARNTLIHGFLLRNFDRAVDPATRDDVLLMSV